MTAAWISVNVHTNVEYVSSLKWWKEKLDLPSVPSDCKRMTRNGMVLLKRTVRASNRIDQRKPIVCNKYLRTTGCIMPTITE